MADINSEPMTVLCPKCKTEVRITDALAAPLLESARREFERDLASAKADMLVEARKENERQFQAQLSAVSKQRDEAYQSEAKLEDAMSRKVSKLEAEIEERERKLAEAQKEQARLLLKETEHDAARRELDLTVARRVNESAADIRLAAERAAADNQQLRLAEKDEALAAMSRQIDELKRRADQGDNRAQGEAQELVLEQTLRAKFPGDSIEPVGKGVFGGDTLHRVLGTNGQAAGTMLWESKRTKNWERAWLGKLRDDQRAARADLAVLVTQVMPRDPVNGRAVEGFDLVDGVWVVEWRLLVPVAIALRQSLLGLAAARIVRDGQQTKSEIMYTYLTGSGFRHRVQAIVERFGEMGDQLRKERAASLRGYATREQQIQAAMDAAAGMWGDLAGILGSSLPELEEVKLLETEQPQRRIGE